MKNSLLYAGTIRTIAEALGDLNNEVVYVGGAIVGIYADDPGAADIRPTKDIDIVVRITTEGELERLRQQLMAKGFTQTAEDDVICRFRYKKILVDVMSTSTVGWAPANPWFEAGFRHSEQVTVELKEIRILSLPYFLATKLSAFHERGGGDPRTSHDVEDIVYILDNRTDLVQQIFSSPEEVQRYLKKEFSLMLSNKLFQEAIRAHLFYGTQTERFEMIIEKLKRIIQ